MCREQLPVWQRFYESRRNQNFAILAVAMDAQGADVARRFTEAGHVTFPTAVDRFQGLWELYSFKVIPNGFLVDERGVLEYAKIGGFDVRDPDDRQAIEHLLARRSPQNAGKKPSFHAPEQALLDAETAVRQNPQDLSLQLTLAERLEMAKQYDRSRQIFEAVLSKDPKSVRALMGLAAIELDLGEQQKALLCLRRAWRLEPDNWVIRKQIWAVEHPDEFYPAINTEWQRREIQREKAQDQKPQ
jgi:tetratricopeptide (TPR) repeat protein